VTESTPEQGPAAPNQRPGRTPDRTPNQRPGRTPDRTPDEHEPDYRFTLANERTLLAYLRTALALDAAGLAAVQFLTSVGPHWGRALAGVLLAAAGTVASAGGYLRFRENQTAMRRGQPLPAGSLQAALAAIVAITSVVAAIAVVLR
jgi:putative membrane protein